MTQPRLYCICGKTLMDEEGTAVPGSKMCGECGVNRCASCLWKHIRKEHPTDYLALRNARIDGVITADLEPAVGRQG